MKRARELAWWVGAAAAVAAAAAAPPALAEEPTSPAPAAPSTATSAPTDEVRPAGPLSATLKIGPAIEASTRATTQLAFELDVAYAIGDRGHVGVAPQLHVIDDAMIVVPVAFQYDVRLPVEGLAVYPRIAAGVAMVPAADAVGFALQPAIGVKWRIDERLHAVLEPVNLPMTFGDPVLLHARILAGVGASL